MTSIFVNFWYLWVFIILAFVYRLFRPKIKGMLGEKTISVILSRLDKNKYKVINDLMLNHSGKTSQIDHVIVSNFGVFVIETKNYKGWIVGDDHAEYWTQVIYKRKEKLYNPLRQNYGHIQALKENLHEYDSINYIPIVVFSVKADLKVKTKENLIYSVKLLKTIKKYSTETINNEQVEAIYNRLLALNLKDKDIRSHHVNEIKNTQITKAQIIAANTCPRCGGELVIRKGKNGTFKGCSNYPKCKFTV
ncbi:NERD domain-containing protein [Dehalobacter sp. TBBPA1]|uniref:NERD domain-containing protein n=1 Tax=Dehalobacter sp. TBBPA1 TaxID=3235037 RepID=UPI0034A1004A